MAWDGYVISLSLGGNEAYKYPFEYTRAPPPRIHSACGGMFKGLGMCSSFIPHFNNQITILSSSMESRAARFK